MILYLILVLISIGNPPNVYVSRLFPDILYTPTLLLCNVFILTFLKTQDFLHNIFTANKHFFKDEITKF